MELVKEIKFNLECVGRILPEDNDNIDAKYPSYIMKTSMEDYPYILVEDVRSIFEFSAYQCWNCDENGITGGTDKVELTDDYECNIIIQELEDELQYEFKDSLTELFNADKRSSSKLFRAVKDPKILDYITSPKFSFSKDPNVMPCDVNVAFLLIYNLIGLSLANKPLNCLDVMFISKQSVCMSTSSNDLFSPNALATT